MHENHHYQCDTQCCTVQWVFDKFNYQGVSWKELAFFNDFCLVALMSLSDLRGGELSIKNNLTTFMVVDPNFTIFRAQILI